METKKTCEIFGCKNISERMYQIAPATNIWLCKECIKKEEKNK